MLSSTTNVLLLLLHAASSVDLYYKEFEGMGCDGEPMRNGHEPDYATSESKAYDGCVDLGNGVSIRSEYCDMSVEPPLLIGESFDGDACGGVPRGGPRHDDLCALYSFVCDVVAGLVLYHIAIHHWSGLVRACVEINQ